MQCVRVNKFLLFFFCSRQWIDIILTVLGNSIDWAYRNNITFSYLIELSTKSFLNLFSDILPTGKEAFVILQTVVENLYMSEDEINSIPAAIEENEASLFSEIIQEQ